MIRTLVLLDPPDAGTLWAPFTGVRPIAELRAGVWKIRERWEASLDVDTAAILAAHAPGFHEGFEPPCLAKPPASGPLIIASSTFAPTGAPITLDPAARRLTHKGRTVAWLLDSGAEWKGPFETGAGQEIDGVPLRGTFDLLAALDRFLAADCLGFAAGETDPVPTGSIVLGDPALVMCRRAVVEPGVVFDTRVGAVVLEAGAEVRHGARLEGPLYVGERSRVLGGHSRLSVFGPRSNANGEISNTILLGYANKAHDGFLGHSVLGHWVNLGAGTTTSNLKNTYGEVSLEVAGQRIATGRQFLGSLIGDHAKTAIGTLLLDRHGCGRRGECLRCGAAAQVRTTHGLGSEGNTWVSEDGFLKVAERVMPRRDVAFTPERRASLSATYRRLVAR